VKPILYAARSPIATGKSIIQTIRRDPEKRSSAPRTSSWKST